MMRRIEPKEPSRILELLKKALRSQDVVERMQAFQTAKQLSAYGCLDEETSMMMKQMEAMIQHYGSEEVFQWES